MLGHALEGSVISTAGLVAQATLPIPQDLNTWPVTAILGLISLVSLGIVAYQIRGTIKTAEALTKVAEKQMAQENDTKELAAQVRNLVIALSGRPCINGHIPNA